MKRMAITGLGVAAFVIACMCMTLIPPLVSAKHKGTFVGTVNCLKVASLELRDSGRLTNSNPNICRVFVFTNSYAVAGTNYTCAVGADSWDYRDRRNVLALTTNWDVLFVDQHGVVPMRNYYVPPGY
jgi:hypothetical protein